MSTARGRQKVSVTVDPELLGAVDEYVSEHQGEGLDRSKVFDEALYCWFSRIQHEALTAQHSAPRSPEDLEERDTWKRIRAAQAPYLVRKYRAEEK